MKRFSAARLFIQGQKLVEADRLEEALAAFTQAIALRPRVAGLYLHQALALSEAARLPEAQAAMAQALALQPRNPVLPMFLGQMLFDHGDYSAARESCERALALNPHNCHALGLQALIDLAQGRMAQGYAHLQQPLPLPRSGLERCCMWVARSCVPSLTQQANSALQSRVLVWVESYLLAHAPEAPSLSQQLLQPAASALPMTRSDSRVMALLDQLLTRGVMGLRRGYAAVRYLRQPLVRHRQQLALRAEEALYLEHLDTALDFYTQLGKHEAKSLDYLEQLVTLHYERGDFRQALTYMQRLPTADSDPAVRAWHNFLLGEMLYQVGEYGKAEEALQSAAAGRVHDYKLSYYLGLCQLRRGATRSARQHFGQAVRLLNPDITVLRLHEMYRVYQARPNTT